MKMKFSMPLKKKEAMDPILPITSPDASKVEEEPDVVATGKLDATSMKLRTNLDTVKQKDSSRKPKTKCDLVGDIAAWILGVVTLFTLGFICGQIYFFRKVEVPLRSYNKVIYQNAQTCHQKYQELHKIALDLEAKLKSKSSNPIAIHEGEPTYALATDQMAIIKTTIPEASTLFDIQLQFRKILSETQSKLDKYYETLPTNFMAMVVRGAKHNKDGSISLDNIEDDVHSALEELLSLNVKIRTFGSKTINDFESMLHSSQWMSSIVGINKALGEIKKKVAESLAAVKVNESSTVGEVAEASKEYSMKVLNGFQQFLDEVESAWELKMSEYGKIFGHADEDYEED